MNPHFTIKKANPSKNHALYLLVLFSITYFIYNDIGISKIIGYAILLTAIAINIMMSRRCIYISRIKSPILFSACSILGFFSLPISRWDRDSITYMITMIVCLLILFSARPDVFEIETTFKMLISCSIFFSIYIIITSIRPNFYLKCIYPYLTPGVQEYALDLMRDGYGVPIGGSIVYADYILIVSTIIILSKLLISRDKSVRSPFKSLCLIALFFLGIILEGRRGELLCALISCFTIFLLSIDLRKKKDTLKKFKLFGFISVLAILVISLLIQQGYLTRFVNTFKKILSISSSGIHQDISSGRFKLWGRAIELFKSSPIYGIGWGRYANYVFGSYREIGIDSKINDMYVHNDYLNILCETGIIGFILIFIPFLYVFYKTFTQNRRLQKRGKQIPDKLKTINMISLGIQLFWGILSFLDPCFYKFFFWYFYTIALILFDTSMKMEKKLNTCETTIL